MRDVSAIRSTDINDLRAAAALARIQVHIEQMAYKALLAMDLDALSLDNQRAQIDCAKNAWLLCESALADAPHRFSTLAKTEVRHAFNSELDPFRAIPPFEAQQFDAACLAAAQQAAHGCGLSDVLWSMRVTNAIDGLLASVDAPFIDRAREIAKRHGWMDSDEYAAMMDMSDEQGLCSHGLEPDCCPSGCGDYDEFWAEYSDSCPG